MRTPLALLLTCVPLLASSDEATHLVRRLEREKQWLERFVSRSAERGALASSGALEESSARPASAVLAEVPRWDPRSFSERAKSSNQTLFRLWQPLRAHCHAVANALDELEACGATVSPEVRWRWWGVYDDVQGNLIELSTRDSAPRLVLRQERIQVAERLWTTFESLSGKVDLEGFRGTYDQDRLEVWLRRLERERDPRSLVAILTEIQPGFEETNVLRPLEREGWLGRCKTPNGVDVAGVRELVRLLFPLEAGEPGGEPSVWDAEEVREKRVQLAAHVEDHRTAIRWSLEQQRVIEGTYDGVARSFLERFANAEAEDQRAEALAQFFVEFSHKRRRGFDCDSLLIELRQRWQSWSFGKEPWFQATGVANARHVEGVSIVELQWWGRRTPGHELPKFEKRASSKVAERDLRELGGLLPPGHYVCTLEVQLEGETPEEVSSEFTGWHLCLSEDEEERKVSFPEEWIDGMFPVARKEDCRQSGWFFEEEPITVRDYLILLRDRLRRTTHPMGLEEDWRIVEEASSLKILLERLDPSTRALLRKEDVTKDEFLEGLTKVLERTSESSPNEFRIRKDAWEVLGQRKSLFSRAVEEDSGNPRLVLPRAKFLAALFLRQGNPYGRPVSTELAIPAGESGFAGPLPEPEKREGSQDDSQLVIRRILSPPAEER